MIRFLRSFKERVRVSLVGWEGGSYAVLFVMFKVPLGYPGARSMAHMLRAPFEY